MFLYRFGIILQVFTFKDTYGQFPFPTPLDCNYITHEPCFLYGPGKTCGSDGKDYFNRCRLAQAWCSNLLISIIGDGSCADIGYTRPYITTRPTTQESIRTTTLETTQTISPTVVKTATSNPLRLICSTLSHLNCPKDIEPVCGSDERTYINRCEFNKEVCQHHDLTFKYRVAKTKGMYSKSVSFWATVLIASCRLVTADVCSYTLTRDCAIFTDSHVCGTDGTTYRNNCFLAKAYCSYNAIHKAHDGPCTAPVTTTITTTTATTTAAATTDPLSVICGAMDHVHCANDVEPVCGSDGRSYVNSCEFNKEVCLKHGLTIKHIGFC